jgi:hypothetical protein
MSYIILTGHWFRVIVLNVNASTEDKIDDVKDSVCEEAHHLAVGHHSFSLYGFA